MAITILESEISEEKIKSYSSLLSSVFPHTNKFSPEFLQWQYCENPTGKVIGCDAYDGDILIAHYVTIPVIYLINGKETKGLLSINTATHPSYQGKGLFTELATRTYENGKKKGYEFVIGVANKNSTPGLVKKLGFQLVSPLDVKIGIGSMEVDSSVDYLIRSVWTPELAQWRLSNPAQQYFLNGDYITVPTNVFGITAQLCKRHDFFNTAVLSNKKSVIKLWIGMARKKTQRGVFVNLPTQLKASPLNLIFKSLTNAIPAIKREDIFFELIDFDAY